VYNEISIVSPHGTSVVERVIVRALPNLETNVKSKSSPNDGRRGFVLLSISFDRRRLRA
jgi:hypothetical protein